MTLNHSEFYVEYYDLKGKRGYTKYFLTLKEANEKMDDLIRQGYQEVKVMTYRY